MSETLKGVVVTATELLGLPANAQEGEIFLRDLVGTPFAHKEAFEHAAGINGVQLFPPVKTETGLKYPVRAKLTTGFVTIQSI